MRFSRSNLVISVILAAAVGLMLPHIGLGVRMSHALDQFLVTEGGKDSSKVLASPVLNTELLDMINDRSDIQLEALNTLQPAVFIVGNHYWEPSPEFLDLIARDSVVTSTIIIRNRVKPSLSELAELRLPIAPDEAIPEDPELAVDARILRAGGRWGSRILAEGTEYARSVPTIVRHNQHVYPSIFLQALAAHENVDFRTAKITLGRNLEIGRFSLPIDERGQFLLGPIYGRDHLLYKDSLSNAVVEPSTADSPSIILDFSLYISRLKPSKRVKYARYGLTSDFLTGIALENALDISITRTQEPVRPMGLPTQLILCLLTALAVSYPFARNSPRTGTAAAFVLIVVFIFGAYFVRARTGLLLPLFSLLMTIICSALFMAASGMIGERIRFKLIRRKFAGYISEGALRHVLLRSGDEVAEPVRKEITAVFVDIKGLLARIEQQDPSTAISMVADIMELFVDVCSSHKATLDKIVMETVFIFLNDPIEQEEHPQKALALAQELAKRLNELLAKHPAATGLEYAIGIETGEVVVGNLATPDYATYTAIGSPVNLASRLSVWADPGVIALGPEACRRISPSGGSTREAVLSGVAEKTNVYVLKVGSD